MARRPRRGGVGCCGFREHRRALPRLRVRPFAAHDPAATTASADSCRMADRLSASGVGRLFRRGRHSDRSPRIRAATFLAHPPHLRDGLLMTTGFGVFRRLAQVVSPSMRFVFLGSRFRSTFLPTPPRGGAVGFGLWLRSSAPRGICTPELLPMPGVRIGKAPLWGPFP